MKPKTLKVRAGKGISLPLIESVIVDDPRKTLTEDTVIEVYASAFVRKRIKSGDMVAVEAKPPKKVK